MERGVAEASIGRVVALPIALGCVLLLGSAGCGTTDEASRLTLPPLVTTTSTTSTTTTLPQERFYTVQPGDILTVIAVERGVTVPAIVELNGLEDENDIQAGQTLEIPLNAQTVADTVVDAAGG